MIRALPPALFALALLGASPAVHASVAIDRVGPKVSRTTGQDWLRHPDEARSYQESWTSVLHADDGHILYVSFIYTNLGVLKGSTSVAVSLTPPGGVAKAHRFDHGTKDFKQDARSGRIAIGDSSMTLRGRKLKLVVREKGLSLDVDMDAWTDGVKLHTGRVWLDDAKEQWVRTFFHVPRASFTGTLKVRGKKTSIRGASYVDHIVQNALATEWSTHWWALRHFTPTHTVAFLIWRAPKDRGGKKMAHVLVTDRERVLLFSDRLRMKPGSFGKDAKGHPHARRFTLNLDGKTTRLQGAVRSTRRHERDAVLERLSWMERKVAGLVAGNPVMYRMEGQADLTLTHEGATVELTGPALMESLVLSEGK